MPKKKARAPEQNSSNKKKPAKKTTKTSKATKSQIAKTLIYKRALFSGGSNKTLQDVLQDAYNKLPLSMDRLQEVGDEYRCFTNSHSKQHDMLVGDLVAYQEGQQATVAVFDREKAVQDLNALDLPDKAELIAGILYFAVWKNHVVLIQSSSVRSIQLEGYINWLLQKSMRQTADAQWNLQDFPSKEIRKALEGTKGISFSAPVRTDEQKKAASEKEKDEKSEDEFKKKEWFLEFPTFTKLFPDWMKIPELNAKNAILGKDLFVKLEITWKRQSKNDSTKFLDQVSNQFRHVDSELDYEILTKSGTRIKKDKIKLSNAIKVGSTDEGMPVRSELWEKISDWINALIEEGRIE